MDNNALVTSFGVGGIYGKIKEISAILNFTYRF